VRRVCFAIFLGVLVENAPGYLRAVGEININMAKKKDEIDKLLEQHKDNRSPWPTREQMFRECWERNNGVRNAVSRELNLARVQVWRYAKRWNLI
jgi:hypothetical protein